MQPLLALELIELRARALQLGAHLIGAPERLLRAGRLARRGDGIQLGSAQIGRRTIVLRAELGVALLGEREHVAARRERRGAGLCRREPRGCALVLRLEHRAPLKLRREPRRPRIEWSQALELATGLRMPRRVVATGDLLPIVPHLMEALLFALKIARELGELLHRELHLRQSPFELARLVERGAAALVQLAHLDRHLLELLEARLEVFPVGDECLDLLVQPVEHRAIMVVQRPLAGRALAILARLHELLAMLSRLGVLVEQRAALRLGLLAIAHPFGALGLELSLDQLEQCALLLQLHRDLFLERRRGLDACAALAQRADFLLERTLGVEERAPSPVLARHAVEPHELVAQRRERRELFGQPLQLLLRGLHVGELALDPLDVA